MIYYYDGKVAGFLTAFLDAWEDEEALFSRDQRQTSFFPGKVVRTDAELANRAKRRLQERLGVSFVRELPYALAGQSEEVGNLTYRVLKKALSTSPAMFSSCDRDVLAWRHLVQRVRHELHQYKGLLRFRETEEGNLFACLEPENLILPLLANFFRKRLPRERFLLFDTRRGLACYVEQGGAPQEFQDTVFCFQEGDREERIRQAWQIFYQTVGIEERKNTALMVKNMPKRFWKYLPEKWEENREKGK